MSEQGSADLRTPGREVDARGHCLKCGGTHFGTGWYCPLPPTQEIDVNPESQVMTEMPRYKCHKEVWALKIAAITDPTKPGDETDGSRIITPAEAGYAPFRVDHDYVRKHKPHVGGYYVVYKDGYKSFSPAVAFEEGYTRL